MKNRILSICGAILFLIAQILLPSGTNDASERIAIIRQNPSLWNMGHILILWSVPLLMLGFVRIKELAQLISPLKALLGLLLMLIGLGSELAIAALQLAAEGVVSTTDEAVALQVLTNSFSTQSIQMALFLPFLLLLPGVVLLATPLLVANNCRHLAIGLMLFGLLMVAAGIFQLKAIFIAAAMVAIFIFWKICAVEPGLRGTQQ